MAIIFQDLFTSSISGSWTRVDTNNRMSIVASRCLVDQGLASPAFGDPRLTYGSVARSSLGAFSALIRLTNQANDGPRVSLSPSSTNSAAANASYIAFDYPDTSGAWVANRQRGWAIDYLFVVIPRPGGGFWRYMSGGEYGDFPTATIVGLSGTETDTPLYCHIDNSDTRFHIDNATVLDTASLPAALTTRWGPALAADDFGSGATLAGRSTPFGSKAWSVASGSGAIGSGTVLLAVSTTAQFNAGATARVIEAYVTRVDVNSKGFLYFRGDGTHAGSWRVEIVSDRVALYNPAGLVDQTGAITFTEDVQYHVRVVDWLNHVEIFVNGTEYLQTDNTNQSGQTQAGIGCDAGGTFRVDDLSVWPATVTLNSDFGPFTAIPQGTGSALSSDLFTAADGTALTTYSASWTVQSGTWQINTNRARMSTAGVNGKATRGTSGAGVDHEVRADILLPSTTPVYPIDWYSAVFARYVDANNWLMARFLYQNTSNEVELWEMFNGTQTLIGYTNLGVSTLAPSSTHNLRLAVAGAEAGAWFDAMLVVQATTQLSTGTLIGMGVSDNNPSGQPAWDNLEVRAAVAVSNPTITNLAASSVTSTTATLSCNTNVNCTVYFDYGPSISYGLQTSTTSSGMSHSRNITTLTPSTTYHFRAVAVST